MDQREIGAPGVSVGPVDFTGEHRRGIVGRADLWLERIGSTILTALFLVMTTLGFVQVICRYFLEFPLYWSEELIRYLFVWTTFLGAGVATAQGLHIEIDILSTIMAKKPPVRKEKILRTIRIISTSLMLIFLGYYAYLAGDFLGKIHRLKQIFHSHGSEYAVADVGHSGRGGIDASSLPNPLHPGFESKFSWRCRRA